MEGFNFGWSLGLLEAIGVLVGSMAERIHGGERGKRVAPFRSYVVLAGLLGMSSSLSNMALNYIKYPTKVIFRSCKLIPTMAIAVVWRKKIVSRWEFLAAFSVCAGLVIFGKADAKLEPDFDPRGIAMVMLSVCADAFLPNMQEHVFSMGTSRVEVTFFTNSLTVLGMLLSTAANGNLAEFLSYAVTSSSALLHMLVYGVMSHVAISAHMMVLKEYGGVTAVLVGSTRKSMTIALSFVLFPKPFSYRFVLGGALVLGGLAANVMIKERRKATESGRKPRSRENLPQLAINAGKVSKGDDDGGGGGGDDGSTTSIGNGSSSSYAAVGNHRHHSRSTKDPASESLLPPSSAPLMTGGGGGGGGGISVDTPIDRLSSSTQKRQRHQQQHDTATGHLKQGLLPSWRAAAASRSGWRFAPWRAAAGVPARESVASGEGAGVSVH
ncbi:unnamed protein product [Ectocarpus sp. 4 AP-2014]